jgi:hypothetical protein
MVLKGDAEWADASGLPMSPTPTASVPALVAEAAEAVLRVHS